MKSSLETRLGMFFAVVVIAAFILFELLGGSAVFRRGTDYKVQFKSAKDLKVGDPVKLAGVPVGRVKAVQVAGNRVEVTLLVEKSAPIRTDTTASIQFTGLMGQNFVSLTFGAENSPLALSGALLQSREQADLGDLMTRLDSVASGVEGLTKSFSGEEISKLFGPLTDFMKQNQSNVTAIIQNMQVVTTEMAEGRGTFGKMARDPALYNSTLAAVTNIDQAVSELKPMTTDARTMMADLRKVVSRLEQGQGTLGKLMTDGALYGETTEAMTQLKEIMQKINHGKGSIGELVNDNTFLKNIKLTLQKVDKATESLEDSGPLTVLGSVAGQFF